MFIYTLGDIIGIALFLAVALIAGVYGILTYIRQSRCVHDWHFIDPSFGNKWWECKKCHKKHDSLDKP